MKAESITDSEEERVAADKSFSTKDKSVGRGVGGCGGKGYNWGEEREWL